VDHEEDLEYLPHADLRGVIGELDDFIVAGGTGADLLVVGRSMAVAVADSTSVTPRTFVDGWCAEQPPPGTML
jgi:hypothetical protein